MTNGYCFFGFWCFVGLFSVLVFRCFWWCGQALNFSWAFVRGWSGWFGVGLGFSVPHEIDPSAALEKVRRCVVLGAWAGWGDLKYWRCGLTTDLRRGI